MLERKIEQVLKNWKNAKDRKPLILKGCRQCGNTFSDRRFERETNAHVNYLNF